MKRLFCKSLQFDLGLIRNDGYKFVEFEKKLPLFCKVQEDNSANRCDKCVFNPYILKSPNACFSFPCSSKKRSDKKNVCYINVDLTNEEKALLTRDNYLRWISLRHKIWPEIEPIIDCYNQGVKYYIKNNKKYAINDTNKKLDLLEEYIFLNNLDKEYYQELEAYPFKYWYSKINRCSWEEYPIFRKSMSVFMTRTLIKK